MHSTSSASTVECLHTLFYVGIRGRSLLQEYSYCRIRCTPALSTNSRAVALLSVAISYMIGYRPRPRRTSPKNKRGICSSCTIHPYNDTLQKGLASVEKGLYQSADLATVLSRSGEHADSFTSVRQEEEEEEVCHPHLTYYSMLGKKTRSLDIQCRRSGFCVC